MGTLFLNQVKKQASSFLQDKYKTARLVFTDVTPAELLAEEATNTDPWGPDAITMTRLTEASFDLDDYWRIADVLHRRFYRYDRKEWRRSYKSLVLLEFLLTHGPEDFAEEFSCDSNVIRELGTFRHIDERGFNWGDSMQKKAKTILELLDGGEKFKVARLKALKLTKEIEGFGNLIVSPSSSSSSSSSPSSEITRTSFGSNSTTSSIWNNEVDEPNGKHEQKCSPKKEAMGNDQQCEKVTFPTAEDDSGGLYLWDNSPIREFERKNEGGEKEEEDDDDDDEEEEDGPETNRLINGIGYKIVGAGSSQYGGERVPFRSLSDIGNAMKKKLNRQFSLGH